MANRNRRRTRLRTNTRPGGAGLGRPAKPSLAPAQASPFAQGGMRPRATSPGQQWVNNYQDAHQPKPTLGQPAAPPAEEPKGKKPEFDQPYFDRIDLIGRQETAELGQLDDQERRTKFDFGIDDPTNPFSRTAALKRMFLERGRGRSASLASQGHLYSGAHERAMSRTRREEEEANAGLRRSYEDALSEIRNARSGVKFSSEEDRAAAFQDWLARALGGN
jgi:hypothetical protein